MNPWHPMTDAVDLKHVGKLGEEAGELATVCSRITIQGLDGINPKDGQTNVEWLEDEIADVWANSLLNITRFGLSITRIQERVQLKMDKLRLWHAMA